MNSNETVQVNTVYTKHRYNKITHNVRPEKIKKVNKNKHL